MEGFVYLLENSKGQKYIGSTNDLKRRLSEHQHKHKNSKYTSAKRGFILVYFKKFDNLYEARLYERRIKRNKKYRMLFYNEAEESGLPV